MEYPVLAAVGHLKNINIQFKLGVSTLQKFPTLNKVTLQKLPTLTKVYQLCRSFPLWYMYSFLSRNWKSVSTNAAT